MEKLISSETTIHFDQELRQQTLLTALSEGDKSTDPKDFSIEKIKDKLNSNKLD